MIDIIILGLVVVIILYFVLGGILALTTAAGYTGWKAKAVKDEYTD